jgi:hypothetical protein
MTTKLIIENDATSNGDINVEVLCGGSVEELQLNPGMKHEAWVSTTHLVKISETWPTIKPASSIVQKGAQADALIRAEVATQDKMWGDANERADASKGQLLEAACAQAMAILGNIKVPGNRELHFEKAQEMLYPKDWSGFRDYGSDIANLVVAVAYIRNEIKRRLAAGESFERAARKQPYTGDQPAVSSAEAGARS